MSVFVYLCVLKSYLWNILISETQSLINNLIQYTNAKQSRWLFNIDLMAVSNVIICMDLKIICVQFGDSNIYGTYL